MDDMSNAATQSAPSSFGLTIIDAVEGVSVGIAPEADGTYLALTATASRSFRTVKGAAAWLARRGYSPTGTRLASAAVAL